MSDSVQNPDIEDVLSSIRRLVSHEGGRKATNTNDGPVRDDQSSKLVLTPALRVEQDDVAEEQSPAQNDTLSGDEALELMTPDVPLAFTSARAARQKADGEDQALVLEHPLDDAAPEPQTQSTAVETADDKAAEDHSEDAPKNLHAEEHQQDEHHQNDVEGETLKADHHAPTAHESLTAKIAALEEVIGREPDQWEPESEGLGDNAGTNVDALPWEDHVDEAETDSADPAHVAAEIQPAETVAEDTSATVGEGEDRDLDATVDTGLDLSDMDETILDEAMLRDLVSNIVREELQGALGERITRNVRKLVRREIHRALSAQDFN